MATGKVFSLPAVAHPYLAGTIFVASFILICAKRIPFMPIGRPAAALCGAVLMIFFGIIPLDKVYESIDWNTIILLLGMMMLTLYLERDRVLEMASKALLYRCNSPLAFLVRVCIISGVMAAILTNDTVCVALTPIVIGSCIKAKLPLLPYLMAVATSANVGSVALPVGNPQNMIIATASEIPFLVFFKGCAVAAVIGLALNTALLCGAYYRTLRNHKIDLSGVLDTNDEDIKDEEPGSSTATPATESAATSPINVIIAASNTEHFKEAIELHQQHTGSHRDDNNDYDDEENNDGIKLVQSDFLNKRQQQQQQQQQPDGNILIEEEEADYHRNKQWQQQQQQHEQDTTTTTIPNGTSVQQRGRLASRFLSRISTSTAAISSSLTTFIERKSQQSKAFALVVRFARFFFAHMSLWVLALVLVGFCFGLHMGFTALLGVVIMILIDRKDVEPILKMVDWNLLLFFASLFLLVSGFNSQFFPYVWRAVEPWLVTQKRDVLRVCMFSVVLLVGSNLVSNVPLVLLLSPQLRQIEAPYFTWLLMAFVTTVAGNFTLVGSVANLIVAEKAKAHYQIGFWEYFKFGSISTVLVIAVGAPFIVLLT